MRGRIEEEGTGKRKHWRGRKGERIEEERARKMERKEGERIEVERARRT